MTQLQFNTALLDLRDRLFLYAYSLTLDKDKSHDLLQETCLKALTYREKFTHNTNFSAWIYTIMKNTFINDYKKRERARLIFRKIDNDTLQNIENQASCASPESICISSEIHKSINSLKDEQRIIFKMFLGGYKYEEIAEVTGLPLGTVKSRIFFVRKTLRMSLYELAIN